MGKHYQNLLVKSLEKKDEQINDLKYEIYIKDDYIRYLYSVINDLNYALNLYEYQEYKEKFHKA